MGLLSPAKVPFPLAPVYARSGIEFVQAAARETHPEGDRDTPSAYVVAEVADGTRARMPYVINLKMIDTIRRSHRDERGT